MKNKNKNFRKTGGRSSRQCWIIMSFFHAWFWSEIQSMCSENDHLLADLFIRVKLVDIVLFLQSLASNETITYMTPSRSAVVLNRNTRLCLLRSFWWYVCLESRLIYGFRLFVMRQMDFKIGVWGCSRGVIMLKGFWWWNRGIWYSE